MRKDSKKAESLLRRNLRWNIETRITKNKVIYLQSINRYWENLNYLMDYEFLGANQPGPGTYNDRIKDSFVYIKY